MRTFLSRQENPAPWDLTVLVLGGWLFRKAMPRKLVNMGERFCSRWAVMMNTESLTILRLDNFLSSTFVFNFFLSSADNPRRDLAHIIHW